jgi:hypothetical protein
MTDNPKSITQETRDIETQAEDAFLSIQNNVTPIIEKLDESMKMLISLKYEIDNLGTLLFSLLIKMHEEINAKTDKENENGLD